MVVQEMQVVGIGVDVHAAVPVLLLREAAARHRVLPVWMGLTEATTIELERQHIRAHRPSAHQLIAEVIDFCGRSVERVCVTMLEEGILHAELGISPDLRVSARVSDAVALALHLGVPIHATDAVLEAAVCDVQIMDASAAYENDDIPASEIVDERAELERMRRFLDTATPEDFDTN